MVDWFESQHKAESRHATHQSVQNNQTEASCIGSISKSQESQETSKSFQRTRVTVDSQIASCSCPSVSSLTGQINTTGHKSLVGGALKRIQEVCCPKKSNVSQQLNCEETSRNFVSKQQLTKITSATRMTCRLQNATQPQMMICLQQ